jgi:hypothetical protein
MERSSLLARRGAAGEAVELGRHDEVVLVQALDTFVVRSETVA